MRVLLTTDTIGGVWTFTRELTDGLLRRGHAVALVSLGRTPSQAQWEWTVRIKEQFGTAFCYKASEVPLEWMQDNHSAYSGAERLMLNVIRDFKADVVHASQFCFGALSIDLPKLVTAHSDVLSWAEACRPGGLPESNWLKQYKRLAATGIAGVDLIVSPTHWMQDALARNFSAPPHSQVISNGRSIYLREEAKPRQLQAVTVGRGWDEAKGLAVLNHLGTSMPVMVAGEAHFEGVRAAKSSLVTYLGRLDEDEVLALLQESSLYLVTSIYEPFGLAPLEAALCGCGVLAREIASLREVWGEGAMYFKNADELNELILRLGQSSEEREALQSRSTRRALELSADRMVDGYAAQYEELLATAREHEKAVACAS